MRSKKCHELNSRKPLPRAVLLKAPEKDGARAHDSKREQDECWMEWGSALSNHGANCENYKEWIYLLILLVPLLWSTSLVNKYIAFIYHSEDVWSDQEGWHRVALRAASGRDSYIACAAH